MSTVARLKQTKQSIVQQYAHPDNLTGFNQVFTTLVPLAALWALLAPSTRLSYGLTALVVLAMSLLLVRVFVLMHECGHGSLFRSAGLNRGFGFLFGVLSGMPQFVWSQHHHFHHKTNGNWAQYRGPLAVITVAEFEAMNPRQRQRYEEARSLWLAPLAGFMYVLFNPRWTWLKGTAQWLGHLLWTPRATPETTLRAHAASFRTGYWQTPQQYWHMTANNLVLLSLWALMAWALGPALFFTAYLISVSLAGGIGIVLFTVQHNFEHSYASGEQGWCYDTAALHGTSFLVLPRWLNWITANIAYHHIHHLSARIPNYRLAECHHEHQQLFGEVRRIPLTGVPPALRFILWDTESRRLISVAEHRNRQMQAA